MINQIKNIPIKMVFIRDQVYLLLQSPQPMPEVIIPEGN